MRIKNGWTYHGLSLNVNMDLSPFGNINPCGFEKLPITQVADLVTGEEELLQSVSRKVADALYRDWDITRITVCHRQKAAEPLKLDESDHGRA